MRTHKMLKIAASTLVFGAFFATGNGAVAADETATGSVSSVGASAEAKAREALGKKKLDVAVEWAERAVAAMPANGQYRQLLGDAYFQSGRFQSAETSFADALTLVPGQDRIALKLALSKIALGKGREAIAILDEHKSVISLTDAGLARALAGDLAGAISSLETAARSPQATSKTRQNLAFSYAMAGRWVEARAVASQDLPTVTVDQRLSDWAAVARPRAAWDQLASLLKITPSYDEGQPKALALGRSEPNVDVAAVVPAAEPEVAAAVVPVAEPVVAATTLPEVPAPVAVEAPSAPAAEVVVALPPVPEEPVVAEAQAPLAPSIIFVSKPVVQAIAIATGNTAPIIRSSKTPIKQKLGATRVAARQMKAPAAQPIKKPMVVKAAPVSAPAPAPSKKVSEAKASGGYAVQLGAFASESNADSALASAGGLKNFKRSKGRVNTNNGSLYRVALSGFSSKDEAGRVCAQVRAKGGTCFVRGVAGSDASTRLVTRKAGNGTRLAKRTVSRKTVKVAAR